MGQFFKTAEASKLKPHQKRVLRKLEKEDSILVYHGLGSGKTMTALKASEKFDLPATVIGPASLKKNFKNETAKHKIKATSEYYSYAKPPASPRHKLLVFDEAHRMGRIESKRSRYPDVYSGRKELFLTGTPLRNEPAELIPLLRGVGVAVPRDKKGFNEYFTKEIKHKPSLAARVFKGIKPGTTREAKNLKVLKKLIKGKVDYHAPNTSDYPTVTKETHKILMSPVQHETYKEFMKKKPSLRYKIKHGLPPSKSEAGNMNAFLSASRQISNTPRSFNVKSTPADAPKLNAMTAQIVKYHSTDKNYRGLTYSNYLGSGVYPLSERLTKNKIPHAMFTGKLSDAQKDEVVKEYNTGKVKHLLITGSGAEGLDLKGTKLVQITEPHWNKPLIKQVQGRAVRYKSHAHLPEEERTVKVQKFLSVVPPTKIFKKQYLSADQYLSRLSTTKQKLNDQFLGALKEVGQDDGRG